jgi:hypothetical protein
MKKYSSILLVDIMLVLVCILSTKVWVPFLHIPTSIYGLLIPPFWQGDVIFDTFGENQFIIDGLIYFWVVSSVSLVLVFMPVPCYFDYCSFIKCIQISCFDYSYLVLLVEDCFGNLGPFVVFMNFKSFFHISVNMTLHILMQIVLIM